MFLFLTTFPLLHSLCFFCPSFLLLTSNFRLWILLQGFQRQGEDQYEEVLQERLWWVRKVHTTPYRTYAFTQVAQILALDNIFILHPKLNSLEPTQCWYIVVMAYLGLSRRKSKDQTGGKAISEGFRGGCVDWQPSRYLSPKRIKPWQCDGQKGPKCSQISSLREEHVPVLHSWGQQALSCPWKGADVQPLSYRGGAVSSVKRDPVELKELSRFNNSQSILTALLIHFSQHRSFIDGE